MEMLYSIYGIGFLLHLVFSLFVCSAQKQPIAVRWCVVPVVSVAWFIFSIRMMIKGYSDYLKKELPEAYEDL